MPTDRIRSKKYLYFTTLGIRSLANASRARQFNPLGWVPLPQTNMAAVVGRARSVVRAWSVMRGSAWSCVVVRGRSCMVVRGRACVVGHEWSCVVARAWSCVRGRACVVVRAWSVIRGRARSCAVGRAWSCRSARFAASTAVTRTNERTNNI